MLRINEAASKKTIDAQKKFGSKSDDKYAFLDSMSAADLKITLRALTPMIFLHQVKNP